MNKYLEKIAAKLPNDVKHYIREMVKVHTPTFSSNIPKHEIKKYKDVMRGIAKDDYSLRKIEPSNLDHRANGLIHRIISSKIKV